MKYKWYEWQGFLTVVCEDRSKLIINSAEMVETIPGIMALCNMNIGIETI